MSLSDRIIVPLDVPGLVEAFDLLDHLPEVGFWKVGLELFIAAGPEVLAELKRRGKRIFLDLKLHDIPNTMAGAVRSAQAYDVDFLTIHAPAGQAALKASVAAVSASPLRLLAVTLLTSLSARDLAFDLHVSIELPEYVLKMALLAQASGVPGIVCSPHEAAQLRQICGPDFLLVCPGVRPPWATAGDQQRVMTPAQALQAGASYLVIGRPITQAPDPQAAWQRLVAEL
ncbi:orotidine-5'-phosphate decarboxylase [Spirulina major CS-329]|uniref:orotidine-5'-phosphate decarboxylase n=1 Tax=Spirulina TaxID=1154 RepID=UPI002330623C|nr:MULTISPECIES: orotidine-5'-phosphate decarboxylase [Spirulina]MDB9493112.1 orotidine-5'-phosphate decarboxylase [Spirulina subsalsa CS-330]MDB9503293.1 orotidine-5'-phosphate decarboxylase [Spirulina major CS-329]